MEKKYFIASVFINSLFWILILLPILKKVSFISGFVSRFSIIGPIFALSLNGLLILIASGIFLGVIYLFLSQNRKFILYGFLINVLTITGFLFLMLTNLQASR